MSNLLAIGLILLGGVMTWAGVSGNYAKVTEWLGQPTAPTTGKGA